MNDLDLTQKLCLSLKNLSFTHINCVLEYKLDNLIKNLLDMIVGVSPMAIAVQSPYVAQVQLLRERLDDFPVADGVEVATIDSFQGREADAVIISMVHITLLLFLYFLELASVKWFVEKIFHKLKF